MAQLERPIVTERLILRRFSPDDLDDLASLLGRDDVNRYLYQVARSREETRAVLGRHIERPTEIVEDNILPVAVELASSGRLIGDFILHWNANIHAQGEIGGSVHPDLHGQGFAPEVYEELLRIAFRDFDLHRVIGRCDARNAASIRSLEKAGLHQEAHFVENEFVKGEWTSEVVLAVLQREWLVRDPLP
jgi:RimJ/RimL family protein N-acetyltransferase